MASVLTEEFLYHHYDSYATYNSKVSAETQQFRRWIKSFSGLTDELERCKYVVWYMLKKDFVKRSVAFLNSNVRWKYFINISERDLFDACKVLIGDKGWRQIGTEKNIIEVLKHTTLQLTLGREKQSFELKDLL